MLSLWMAYALNLMAIFLVYRGLFGVFKLLWKRNVFWAASLAVFLSPFAYVLSQVSSPLELMWVLLLTPFLGTAIMMTLFTSLMIRYYCAAFLILAAMHLVARRQANPRIPEDVDYHKAFWDKIGKAPVRTTTLGTEISGRIGQTCELFEKRIRKHWNLILIAILIVAVTSTFIDSPRASFRNPTYEEALKFVVSDQTNNNQYAEDNGLCAKFAEDFRSNALKAGYSCGYVLVYFPDGKSHALNAFNTTGAGLVFIEPQSDEIVTVAVGEPYWNRAKYEPPSYDDTVIGYRIIW